MPVACMPRSPWVPCFNYGNLAEEVEEALDRLQFLGQGEGVRYPRAPESPGCKTLRIAPGGGGRCLEANLGGGAVANSPAEPTCDKCDGHHLTQQCPFFKGAREAHKDAWVNYGKGGALHQMGADGGNFVLRSAKVVRQPGDGSCLFHSLNHGLASSGLNSAPCAQHLRAEIARFLRDNPQLEIAGDSFEEWVRWDAGVSVGSYADGMEGGSSWGGGIELAACSRLKKVNVHVYERRGRGGGFLRISRFDCEEETASTIHVLYQGRMHYDFLELV